MSAYPSYSPIYLPYDERGRQLLAEWTAALKEVDTCFARYEAARTSPDPYVRSAARKEWDESLRLVRQKRDEAKGLHDRYRYEQANQFSAAYEAQQRGITHLQAAA